MIFVNGKTVITQRENEFLDYRWDLQFYLDDDADTIATATVTGPGVSLVSVLSTQVNFWLSATDDSEVTLLATTALGRVIERCAKVSIISNC